MAPELVLLADVVKSRRIEDRERFRERLRTAFDAINEAEAAHLTVPLSSMKGVDEFGCVLASRAPLPDIIVPLLRAAHPHGVRFGIAAGVIDVGAGRDTVAEMDGPAFHDASALLEELRTSGLYVAIATDDSLDDLLEGALNLLAMGEIAITNRQLDVIRAYEANGTQAAAGEALGMHQQGVSESLKRAQYFEREAVKEQLRDTLEERYGG